MSKMVGVATAAAGMGAKALSAGAKGAASSQGTSTGSAPGGSSGGPSAPKQSNPVQGFASAFSNNSRPTQ